MIAPLIAVVGLRREARLVTRPGIVAVASGGDALGLRARIGRLAERQRPRAIVSVGLGGALSPGLDVGDWVVADRIVEGARSWSTDAGLVRQLEGAVRPLTLPTPLRGVGPFPLPGRGDLSHPNVTQPLPLDGGGAGVGVFAPPATEEVVEASPAPFQKRGALTPIPDPSPIEGEGRSQATSQWNREAYGGEPGEGEGSRRRFRVFTGAIAGSDVMLVDAAAKAALHTATGALAVDMESHVAAAFAAAHGIPFAALRVISDDANRALPSAAQAGMKKDGGMDVLAVLKALARDPRQLPALIRTGREAEVAFRQLALLNRHDLLGRLGVGDADLDELALDVV